MGTELLLLLPLLTFAALIFLQKRSKNSQSLPPGPPKLPLIGNFHQLKLPLHKSFFNLATQYGDVFFLKLGVVPTVVISSSDVVFEICKSHDLNFSSRPTLHVPFTLEYNGLGLVFAKYGAHWRDAKRIVTLELLSSKKVQSFETVRTEEVADLIATIGANGSKPVDLSQLLLTLSNNIICRVAFGSRISSNGQKTGIYETLKETGDLLAAPCISDFFPWLKWLNKVNGFDARLQKNLSDLDEIFCKILDEHRNPERMKSEEEEDLVDVLIRLQKGTEEAPAFGDDLIKALIMDIFIAGTSTTAAAMVWTMTELMRNPKVLKRAQEEVREAVGGRERVEERDVKELGYLKMAIKEAMRVHSVVPLLLPRETMEGCVVGGYEVPEKTMVFVNTYAMAVDERVWENPGEFRPERFEECPAEVRGHQMGYIPFGFGRRMCPGVNFGVTALELVLASLLCCFDWSLPDGDNINMEETVGLTVKKKTPLLLVATPTFMSQVHLS